MAYKSLNDFIEKLKQEDELIEINELTDPQLEITEITDRISKSGYNKALLFTNNGTDFPLLINAFGSEKRICLALGVKNLDDIGLEIKSLFKKVTEPKNTFFEKLSVLPSLKQFASWFPKTKSGKGKCQEIIYHDPDLYKLPILKCWPYDGGRFITLPLVHTVDPETGNRNVGMYRMQVFDGKTTGMHWHLHKTGANHFNKYKKTGKIMPVAVALGGDPVYTYSATAPLPENIDEYLLAGFIRKKRVELVKCITQEIFVPEDADYIIEGYVDPSEAPVIEGPFGDHTGFYSLQDYYPKFHVTCITHRKNAVYPATIVGIPPQEDAWIGKATERLFLSPIQLTMLPELLDMDLPFSGVAHNLAIVKIDSAFPGHALKVMNTLWGAGQMMFNKNLLILPGNTNIHDYEEVCRVISKNVDPMRDVHFGTGPLDILDHSSSQKAFGGKMCIDATNEGSIVDSINFTDEEFLRSVPEAKNVNSQLLKKNISVIIISVKDNNCITKIMLEKNIPAGVKFIFITDGAVDLNDYNMVSWMISGNSDPKRDHFFIEKEGLHTMVIDATTKHGRNNFDRDWPNATISDATTIKLIDEKWNKMFSLPLINSPSNKYKKLIKSGLEKIE
ncbi:MAG: menaquinone biosynthesis decarboxylase [Bacteroidetes bacterium GWF2_38_335]|nr:MAG: menaquinone biosynthesis decarboxylase [Bacteroidetes bacterium GWF2_38_335]OFY81406.1 MAG: menaquinone biosynthesis decarboxylase [Bacteroidetes bacterium RIFOXYA12_FULL_38_20]HBS85530.1 menaquinone biosynthesis decarboxylase [Bacteroidales bacterium]